MIVNLIQTIFLIVLIYIVGFSIYLLLFKQIRNNIFLVLAFSFVLGNLFFCLFLTMLAMLGWLNFSITFILPISIICVLFLLRENTCFRLKTQDFSLLAFLAVFFFILIFPSMLTPLIGWDTRAMWLVKAKTFFVDNGFPNAFFNTVLYSHRDYPIGFPLLLSLFFRVYGIINEQAIKIYLMTYFFNIILLFIGIVRSYFKNISNIFLILFIFGFFFTGVFLQHSVSGYADLPLSLTFSVAVASFALAMTSSNVSLSLKYLTLVFLSALFSLNIKNEGLTFFILNSLFITLFILKKIGYRKITLFFRTNVKCTMFYIIILIILLTPIILWLIKRGQLGLKNDIATNVVILSANEYIIRIKTISRACISMMGNISFWGISLVTSVPLLLAFIGIWLKGKAGMIKSIPGLIIILQGLVYFLLYMITPHDLTWHLGTSLDRLFLHLVPSIYITVVYYLKVLSSTATK